MLKSEAVELVAEYEGILSDIYDEATSDDPDPDKIASMVADVIDIEEE